MEPISTDRQTVVNVLISDPRDQEVKLNSWTPQPPVGHGRPEPSELDRDLDALLSEIAHSSGLTDLDGHPAPGPESMLANRVSCSPIGEQQLAGLLHSAYVGRRFFFQDVAHYQTALIGLAPVIELLIHLEMYPVVAGLWKSGLAGAHPVAGWQMFGANIAQGIRAFAEATHADRHAIDGQIIGMDAVNLTREIMRGEQMSTDLVVDFTLAHGQQVLCQLVDLLDVTLGVAAEGVRGCSPAREPLQSARRGIFDARQYMANG